VNLFWVILVTVTSVSLGAVLCLWLLHRARAVDTTVWTLEHIFCPIIRIVVLLLVVSQIYPVIDDNTTSTDFWRALAQGQFSNLLNILFLAGLLLSFIPLVSHPLIALPLQSMLTVAFVFHWQYAESIEVAQLLPSMATLLKVLACMLLAYLVTREVSIYLSRWIDSRMDVSGSIRLVADAIYLVLQIPVILIYCGFLKLQLG
jgi:hypothetical protein